MNRLYREREWKFISSEMKDVPKQIPFRGKTLLKRELLFCLRALLIEYLHEKKRNPQKIRKQIYLTSKEFYLNFETT